MTHRIVIPGAPRPLLRARRSKHGGMYDPKQNREAKEAIGWCAKRVLAQPIEGPVMVNIRFYMPRPKSHSGKTGLRKSAPRLHAQKPDVDNLVKAVFDGFNKTAWLDDTQVIEVKARKDWAMNGDAFTMVEILEVSQ